VSKDYPFRRLAHDRPCRKQCLYQISYEKIVMNDGSVSIKKLVKTYVDDRGRPTFTAVKNIDLDIQEGEFLVLVGPSGCGKSTTLRMVAGLEKISNGTIEIGGRVVNDMEPKDRGIAMVFQNYALYPHMTIFNNMAFAYCTELNCLHERSRD
jgi:ABC-type sugar transport system ATPase subunit